MDVPPSVTRARLKALARLKNRSARQKEGLHLLEGPNLVEEAIATCRPVEILVTTEDDLTMWTQKADGPVHLIAPADFQRISTVKRDQGVMAIGPVIARAPVDALLSQFNRLLLLDGVQDPGNVGTLVRTALALGVQGVILRGACADPDNPKVLRASAGSLFRIPIAEMQVLDEPSLLHQYGHLVVTLVVRDGKDLRTLDPPERFVLVMGNEGAGADVELQDACEVTIPMEGEVESLNVSAACAVVLGRWI